MEADRSQMKCTSGDICFFCDLKAFRRIATRYEKPDRCVAALNNLVATFLQIRRM